VFRWIVLPATLDAYINKYSELVPYLATNATRIPSSNATPPEQTSKAISLQVSLPSHLV
jgi:neutral ceramidase